MFQYRKIRRIDLLRRWPRPTRLQEAIHQTTRLLDESDRHIYIEVVPSTGRRRVQLEFRPDRRQVGDIQSRMAYLGCHASAAHHYCRRARVSHLRSSVIRVTRGTHSASEAIAR